MDATDVNNTYANQYTYIAIDFVTTGTRNVVSSCEIIENRGIQLASLFAVYFRNNWYTIYKWQAYKFLDSRLLAYYILVLMDIV